MALDLPIHGGDLTAAASRWHVPLDQWLDLSTGINPWPYPVDGVRDQDWTRLPSSQDEQDLRQAAARYYGCKPNGILAAPGSSALISALARLLPPTHVAILSPTYGEHERAWRLAGHDICAMRDLSCAGSARVVVLVNPNNPDGWVYDPMALTNLAERLAERGGFLVVDEAFADTMPAISSVPWRAGGMVILRSFGKFFGLAGVRLGFCIAEAEILESLSHQLGPWPVSGPALRLGARALADTAWHRQTQSRLTEWGARLDRVLEAGGLALVGGTALFRLTASDRAPDLYDRLGRAGILVRAFAHDRRLLRVGLPPDQDSLDRLARVLA